MAVAKQDDNIWHLFVCLFVCCLFAIFCQHVSQADLGLSVPSTSTYPSNSAEIEVSY